MKMERLVSKNRSASPPVAQRRKTLDDYFYRVQTPNSRASFTGPTRYKGDEFYFCCCCLSLRGTCADQAGNGPKLIADGVALTKKEMIDRRLVFL